MATTRSRYAPPTSVTAARGAALDAYVVRGTFASVALSFDDPHGRPLLLGHRGCAADDVVENTVEAFRRAVSLGADGVELDVRLTIDGVPVVLHDADFARLGSPTRRVAEMTAEEVAAVSLRDGAGVPRFDDALAWAAAADVLLNVELKVARDANAAEIDRMIHAVGEAIGTPARGAVLASSFNAAAIRRWIAVWPEIPAALLVSTPDAFAVWRTLDGCAALHPAGSIVTPALIDECRSRGQRIHVWTLNDPGEIKASLEAGVDAVITDLPEVARDVRARVLAAG